MPTSPEVDSHGEQNMAQVLALSSGSEIQAPVCCWGPREGNLKIRFQKLAEREVGRGKGEREGGKEGTNLGA